MNHEDFYRAFEDRYRGSRELIKLRLEVYRPFVEPLLVGGFPRRTLDLGCGRGEWLELMAQWGFNASGVDLSDSMLSACGQLGLSATHGDALAALEQEEEGSLAVVSAFHLVEHLAFEDVQQLIGAALRALCPGGLLILETPNPENLVVGANSFYLDPTHVRPLPPPLLAFATDHAGFTRNKVVRLQERSEPGERSSIEGVLNGVSPDYSVVAQKRGCGDAALTARFDAVFAQTYGVSLDDLARSYDGQWKSGMAALDSRLSELRASIEKLDAQTNNVNALAESQIRCEERQFEIDRLHASLGQIRLLATGRIEDLQSQLAETRVLCREATDKMESSSAEVSALESRIESVSEFAHSAELRASQAEEGMRAMRASRSWRITWPMRAAGSLVRSLLPSANPRQQAKRRIQASIRRCVELVDRNPSLRRVLVRAVNLAPGAKERIQEAMSARAAPLHVPASADWLTASRRFESERSLPSQRSHLDQRSPLERFASKDHTPL